MATPPAAKERKDWATLVAEAESCSGLAETLRLDRALTRSFGDAPPTELAARPVRLAVLGDATLEHLLPGIRVGALKRGMWLAAHASDYGQYMQPLADTQSTLVSFAPNTVLFAFGAAHLFGEMDVSGDAAAADAALAQAEETLVDLWRKARARFGAQVIQQTLLPTAPPLMGHNEHLLPCSPARLTRRFNERLRALAEAEGVDLLAIDECAARDGLATWHDPALWHWAKQDISPAAVPRYGEEVARLLAAALGRSYKCLVLDLDNTLWGGVIGDDGLHGITLGQGSALGEAHLAVQRYARDLSRRGVILAVCSKNDEAIAWEPFDQHPEMLLKREDIACFAANWDDKPANLRHIAATLNIGLDALVFVDDNPFERALVRRELPEVAVPELPEDPALFAQCIAAGGYFEALRVTEEDRGRTRQYQENQQRDALKTSSANLGEYLQSLGMALHWGAFDRVNLPRIVQLINKTNQFNLTTRCSTEEEARAHMRDPCGFTMQLRLTDRFGDNGIIGAVIGKLEAGGDLLLDTWLMSCRVLGRGVEEATLNLIAAEAMRLGAERLIGEYYPTAKNAMVREHYPRLGFAALESEGDVMRFAFALADFTPRDNFIATTQTVP